MLSGLMMQIAMQLGLHRPVQAEEFTTFRMEVQGEALKDRLHTWVICNIVAQKFVLVPCPCLGYSIFSISTSANLQKRGYWLWPTT